MAPSPTSDTQSFYGYDICNTASSTAYSRYRRFSGANGVSYLIVDDFNYYGSDPTSPFYPQIDPGIVKKYAKFLNDAEKAWLRRINFKPTAEGVRICRDWHGVTAPQIQSLPSPRIRYDRRIPCWRAGRWKSLT